MQNMTSVFQEMTMQIHNDVTQKIQEGSDTP